MSRKVSILSSLMLVSTALAGPPVVAQDSAATVGVTVQEFAVVPDTASIPAGSVTLDATNEGPQFEHELVVVKTDLAAADLPTNEDGSFDEDADGVEVLGEIEEFAPGTSESLSVDLEPGHYVFLCNVVVDVDGSPVSHYQQGMRVDVEAVASAAGPMTREELRAAMRKLWEDHITWTRLFIVSKATINRDLPDLDATVRRLLANQTDIGNAVKPFYGEDAGNQLTKLLETHITTAADLVGAAKEGDKDAVKKASDAWYANADEIADFLSAANPDNWPQDEMRAMMKDHLDLTLGEATAQIEGKYAASVKAYDDVHTQILAMADMLSEGIIAQFPDMFTS
jgi:hypothetical protein